jgi:hypothetical protein
MRWYVGPWQWNESEPNLPHWSPPVGAVGALDLRSIPQQSVERLQDGYGIFASRDELPSDYELLGTGSLRDVKTSQRLTDRIPKRDRKRQPKGDDLLSLLLDAICDGSDPTGDSFAKPLMPDADMRLSLTIGDLSIQWKTAPWNYHWDKIQDVERADFQRCFDDAKSGKLKDGEHHRRMLDALCDKYNLQGVDDWKSLVPAKIRKEIKGRLKHETTITDNFNRANAASLGTSSEGFTWTRVQGFDNTTIISNEAGPGVITDSRNRANADLSSSDLYSQIRLSAWIANDSFEPIVRASAAAVTFYIYIPANAASNTHRIFKCVGGTFSSLQAASGNIPSTGQTAKLIVSGSSLVGSIAGVDRVSVTDTAITGNIRCGFGINANSTALRVDDFEAGDVAASTVTYTRLETLMRGVTRGVYTRNGG